MGFHLRTTFVFMLILLTCDVNINLFHW